MIRNKGFDRLALMVVVIIFLGGCGNERFRETGDMSDFDAGSAIMDGYLENTGDLGVLTYEGSGQATRYSCAHQAKIKLTINPDSRFELLVTTPTVTNNCQPGGDWETAKISGEVKMNGDEMYFQKCNSNPFPPEGLGNYTLTAAAGGVSCFSEGFDGKAEKWLQVSFDVKRISP
jgi:hypothetical protein